MVIILLGYGTVNDRTWYCLCWAMVLSIRGYGNVYWVLVLSVVSYCTVSDVIWYRKWSATVLSMPGYDTVRARLWYC